MSSFKFARVKNAWEKRRAVYPRQDLISYLRDQVSLFQEKFSFALISFPEIKELVYVVNNPFFCGLHLHVQQENPMKKRYSNHVIAPRHV